jgi:hypothetical protein
MASLSMKKFAAVVESGLLVQIDDAFLASTYDVMVPPASLEDYRNWAALRVDALNHALHGIPPEKCRYHLCWGSCDEHNLQPAEIAFESRDAPGPWMGLSAQSSSRRPQVEAPRPTVRFQGRCAGFRPVRQCRDRRERNTRRK